MKGTSKVIMGATLIMVVTLAVVLGLILVLLTELYCSLLLRRRRLLRASASASASASAAAAVTTRTDASPSSPTSHPRQHSLTTPPPPPPFTSIYAQGVLQAPRNFLFPLVSSKEELTEAKKQLVELHQATQIQTRDFITSPRHLGLVSASSTPPQPIQAVHDLVQGSDDTSRETICGDHLVYISNPIYENDEEGKGSSGSDTPFQTPHTSPSRLETVGSSGEDEAAQASSSPSSSSYTPPLSPMKKLPAEASSVSLKDAATSLANSVSDSHSNNGLTSSSSATPCTSPSW